MMFLTFMLDNEGGAEIPNCTGDREITTVKCWRDLDQYKSPSLTSVGASIFGWPSLGLGAWQGLKNFKPEPWA
jgi:hypothetical protein